MLRSIINPVSRFFAWWIRELSGLMPGAGGSVGRRRGSATVISIDKERLDLIVERGRTSGIVASALRGDKARRGDSALRQDKALRRDDLVMARTPGSHGTEAGLGDEILALIEGRTLARPVGLRVSLAACLDRRIEIPAAARSDAGRLAALDLERATPFRTRDVLTAVQVEAATPSVNGRIRVRQIVLKRDAVDGAMAALEGRGIPVAFVDCWDAERAAALPVDFLASTADATGAPADRPGRTLDRMLTATAAAAALAALVLVLVKHENALAVSELETRAARASAAGVSQRIAQSEAALAEVARLSGIRQQRPRAVDILDEVTRLLPDGAYLTEFNLDGDVLDLAGLARQAAPLLEAFERSRLFADARFSAPFRLDPREDRERFAMRVRLRATKSEAAAGITGGKG